jgi:hypothetical protein
MSYRKRGGGLLGLLSVVVLGVLVFAGSAQGVTPLFNVGGSTALQANITGTQEGTGTLLVPNSNLSLQCPEFEVIESVLLSGGLIGHATILTKGCKAFEHKNPSVELPCHVSDVAAGQPGLLHITGSGLVLPVEFADGGFGGLVEKLTVTVNFLSGTGCPLPLKNVVKGEVCVKVTSGNDTTKPLIKSSKTIQSECPEVKLEGTGAVAKDKLLFGANEAFVEAQGVLFAIGEHEGKTIGVLLL